MSCLEMDSEDMSNANPRRAKEKAIQVQHREGNHEMLWGGDEHPIQESPASASMPQEPAALPTGAELTLPIRGRSLGTSPEVRAGAQIPAPYKNQPTQLCLCGQSAGSGGKAAPIAPF